jgi:hypothetical protein
VVEKIQPGGSDAGYVEAGQYLSFIQGIHENDVPFRRLVAESHVVPSGDTDIICTADSAP